MLQRKMWSVAGMVVAGAALSACASGSAGRSAALHPSPAGTVPTSQETGSSLAATTHARRAPQATAAAGSRTADPVLLVRSFDGTVGYDGREPSSIGFSGDSTNIVSQLTWSVWGPATAVGHGLLGVDDCKPDCASATVTHVPATVHLTKVVAGHFTAMTEKSGTLNRSYAYPSDWATSAS